MPTFNEKITKTVHHANMFSRQDHTEELCELLIEARDKLAAVISQADAQFKCGDRHATFNKQFIDLIR